ncbi:MAG: TIGR01777 family oxidoreductase [Planctomycetota bacterium]
MTSNAERGRVVIAGGSGFLGQSLAAALVADGWEVVTISRSAPRGESHGRHETWDVETIGDWAKSLDGAAALVNLAGRTVDCIKTPDHCDEILRSRVESTTLLGRALRTVDQPPPVWVQMSTAHIYGDPPTRVCDEDAAFGYGLAPIVGKAWEKAHREALLPDMRSVVVRTSFVMGRTGGALPRLAGLARVGLGGTIGHGRQGMSWIHERDMNGILVRAIADSTMQGAYLATAPQPVSNKEFMRSLRKAIGMPIGLPAAGWMVRIGAPLFLRTDPELALYGRYCVSRRLAEENFEFAFPDLPSALADLYRR